MALGAPLAERELRAAVRAGADEARVRPTGAQRRRAALVGDDLPPPHRVPGRGYGGRAEQVLLHPLLVLHPLLDGDAMASGTDITLFGPRPTTRSDEMPRSWRYTSRNGIPDRRASELSRPMASTSAIKGAPALPSEMNTSNGWPLSSSVMFTYMMRRGVSTRRA